MSHSDAPDLELAVLRNVRIPTRDGIRLAADIYGPEDVLRGASAPVPVVMEYTPYRKDDVVAVPGTIYHDLPRAGYSVARVDVRGTGSSEGSVFDEYTEDEQLDGYDAVEWLARQPWCDGHVAMMGISYGGFTSLQVATHQPPHLTTIVPIDFTDDRYTDDCHYRGGLMRMYYDVGFYGTFMVAYNALPPRWEGSDEAWADSWEARLHVNEPYILRWLEHQTDGDYWRQGSVRYLADRIRCPVFLIGGWRDGYPNPPLRLYEALTVPKKLLMGPWDHALPDAAIPGPRIDYLREVVRWADHWCKGTDTGIVDEPPIAVFMQRYQTPSVGSVDSAGEWRAEVSWPPPHAGEQTLYLAAGGRLDPARSGNGRDTLRYLPFVGLTGGLWSGGVPFGLPGDQRSDEAYSLVYTSEPLEKDLHIIGRPKVVLHVSSTAPVIAFAASLSEVGPDGASHLVAKGIINATRRSSLEEPTPLIQGETYELVIDVDATAWAFTKGNRIRLSIANSDWPNVWPTPEPAMSTISMGRERPSRLILPTVAATGSACTPVFHPSPKSYASPSQRLAVPPRWEVVHDQSSSRSSVQYEFERQERVDPSRFVRRVYTFAGEVDREDPSRCSAFGRHVSTIVDGQIAIEAHSQTVITATAAHFHAAIDLEVRMNGITRHTRSWTKTVPRKLL